MPARGLPSLGSRVARLLVLSVALASAAGVRASELEGRVVRTVRLRAPPGALTPADLAELEARSELRPGVVLDPDRVRDAIERLFRPERFATVRVLGRPIGLGEAAVEIVLEPRQVLEAVDLEGADALGVGWVLRSGDLRIGRPVDHVVVGELQEELQKRLARRGWRSAEVSSPRLVPVGPAGEVRLDLSIALGPRTRLGQVQLEGRLPFPLGRSDLGVAPGEVLDLERVEPAVKGLRDRLRRLGYLDAQVPEVSVVSARSVQGTRVADLRVRVESGPRTRIRIMGNRRVATRRLMEDAALLYELGTDEAARLEVEERMLARYHRLGYADARIEVRLRRSPSGRRQVLGFRVREGLATRVVQVLFPGAESLSRETLLEQVDLTVERFIAPASSRAGVDLHVLESVLRGGEPEGPRRRPSTRPPETGSGYVPRAYRAATEAIADAYRAQGFQQVEVSPPEIRTEPPGLVTVRYPVSEGPRWRLASVAFAGHGALPGAALLSAVDEAMPVDEAPPLTFDAIEEARRAIAQLYRDEGFAFVEVVDELRVSPEPGSEAVAFGDDPTDVAAACRARGAEGPGASCPIEVLFRVSEGPVVRVGRVLLRGGRRTRENVLEGEIAVEAGELLRERDLVRTRDNLIELGILRSVDVHMFDEEEVAEVKDVVVEVREGDPYALELGFGVSTEEGLRVFSSFQDRNLLGTALRFRANAKVNLWAEPLLSLYEADLASEIRAFYEPFGAFGASPLALLEYEVGAGLSYPRIFWLPRGLALGLDLSAIRDYDPAFSEENRRVTLTGTYDGFRPRILGRRRPARAQIKLDVDTADLLCNEAVEGRDELCSGSGVVIGNRAEGRTLYFSTVPRVTLDVRDDPLDPRRGVYFELEGEHAVGLDAASPDYVRLQGRATAHLPLGEEVGLHASLQGERIFRLSDDVEIPLNRRLYSGGRSTIRGYPERTLLPRDVPLDVDGRPRSDISSGGLLSIAAKLELRFLVVAPVSMALFYDVGDLWRLEGETGACGPQGFDLLSTTCLLPDGERVERPIAMGAGLGLRVATPIGPLSVDLAFPVARRDPAVESWTLHFSVGAF